MVTINELAPRTAEETYEAFRSLRETFKLEEFNFVLFYGNPTETEISWCPDCRTAHVEFVRYAKDYKGSARFHTIPVGSREEFNKDNPFIKNAPHLDAVPTLAIYRDNKVYLKLIDPTFQDVDHFAKKHKL